MVWDSPLSHQSFPALGETTPRPLMGADSGRMLNSFKKKTPNTGTSGKDYTNVIDMQESNKFLPISKYSPKMNTRLQSMSLLKQQNIYDNRQKIRDLFFKLRRLYRQGKSSNEPAPLRNAMTGNPFISSYSDNATDRNHSN